MADGIQLGAYLGLMALFLFGAASADVRSFTTGGLTVSHNSGDEGLYFATTPDQVAYNVQIIRTEHDTYYTIAHTEPRKPAELHYPGDAIKTAFASGPFTYTMPPNLDYRLYGTPSDTVSLLYSPEAHGTLGWGGTGNPMVVKGRPGDDYFYAFFLAVADDDRDRDLEEPDFRHYICQARSLDMLHWELRVEVAGVLMWKPFTDEVPPELRRPRPVEDVDGNPVRGLRATLMSDTQGLIGSISYVSGLYHFFYTDVAPDGTSALYCRTCPNLTLDNAWSAPVKLTDDLMLGTLIRVAKARERDRWVVLYNGYKRGPDGNLAQDLFLQYTDNLNLTGPGSLAELTFFDEFVEAGSYRHGLSNHYLGLVSGTGVFAQHYFLTDEYGNLTVPDQEEGSPNRGGMLTWAALTRNVYGDDVYRAGWDVQQ